MAQHMATSTGRSRRKREPFVVPVTDVKKRPPQLPLYFPPDAEALLTPFREKALHTIYEIAQQQLGDRIKSTVVLTEDSYDEPGHTSLVLAIWADIDKTEWVQADRGVSDAVFAEEDSWTENERDDYLDVIRFEILPLNT